MDRERKQQPADHQQLRQQPPPHLQALQRRSKPVSLPRHADAKDQGPNDEDQFGHREKT